MSDYTCELCNYNTNRLTNFKRHLKSSKHLRCGKPKTWKCVCCDMVFKQKCHFNDHLKTGAHQEKIELKQLTFIGQLHQLIEPIRKLTMKNLILYSQIDELDAKINPPGWLNWYDTKLTPRQQQWSGMIDRLRVKIERIDEEIENKTETLYDLVYPVMDKLKLTKHYIYGPLHNVSFKDCKKQLFESWRNNMNKLKEKENIKKIVRSNRGLLYILNSNPSKNNV